MRKLILNLAISLDGYIEGPNGEYDWCFTDQDYGMGEFYNTIDAVFMGRKTFEMISADPDAFADKKIYVFSDTLQTVENKHVEVITKAKFKQRFEEIRNEEGQNIWLFGGADLVSSFVDEKMINILLLSVHPVILGAGKRLFHTLTEKVDLMLVEHQIFNTGLVQLKYVIQPIFDYSLLNPETSSLFKSYFEQELPPSA